MTRHVIMLLAAVIALVLGSAGCATDPTQGYAASSIFPENVKTIAIPIFENDSFVRDVQFELTDAVIKEVQAQTPYRIAPAARADTILLGHIRTIELDQLSKSRLTGLSEETIVSVSIDFQWRDLRSDQSLVERRSFSGHGLFIPSRPSGEPIELGQFAVVKQLARDLVSEMQSAW